MKAPQWVQLEGVAIRKVQPAASEPCHSLPTPGLWNPVFSVWNTFSPLDELLMDPQTLALRLQL